MEDSRFDVIKDNDCYLVIAKTITPTKDGHIHLRMNGDLVLLHRYVYEDSFGEIPKGLVVRHKCDNPNCINPNHLELGTHVDNVRDRVERNRSAKGESNGRTKLTEEQARFIKYDTNHTNSGLARMFNVSPKAVRLIKQGVNWKHI